MNTDQLAAIAVATAVLALCILVAILVHIKRMMRTMHRTANRVAVMHDTLESIETSALSIAEPFRKIEQEDKEAALHKWARIIAAAFQAVLPMVKKPHRKP